MILLISIRVLAALAIASMLAACRQQSLSSSEIQFDISFSHTRVGEAEARVALRDRAGQPIDHPGPLRLRGDMSHAGMKPVIVEAEAATTGVFTLPFEWTMAGDWIIEASLRLDSGEIVKEAVNVAIDAAHEMSTQRSAENSAVYLRIVNHGDKPVAFASARADIADRIEFHQTVIENDMARMQPIESLRIPPGESLHLRPGGKHIMLRGLKRDLVAGAEFDLELISAAGDAITLTVPIMSMWPADMNAEIAHADLTFSEVWARPASARHSHAADDHASH